MANIACLPAGFPSSTSESSCESTRSVARDCAVSFATASRLSSSTAANELLLLSPVRHCARVASGVRRGLCAHLLLHCDATIGPRSSLDTGGMGEPAGRRAGDSRAGAGGGGEPRGTIAGPTSASVVCSATGTGSAKYCSTCPCGFFPRALHVQARPTLRRGIDTSLRERPQRS